MSLSEQPLYQDDNKERLEASMPWFLPFLSPIAYQYKDSLDSSFLGDDVSLYL
jgi:hypothetical protein